MTHYNIQNGFQQVQNNLQAAASSMSAVAAQLNTTGLDISGTLSTLDVNTVKLDGQNTMTGTLRIGPLELHGNNSPTVLMVCPACGVEVAKAGMTISNARTICLTCTAQLFSGLINQLVVAQNPKTLLLQQEGSADTYRSVAYNCWGTNETWCLHTTEGPLLLPRRFAPDGKTQGQLPVCDHCVHQVSCLAGNDLKSTMRVTDLLPDLQEKLL